MASGWLLVDFWLNSGCLVGFLTSLTSGWLVVVWLTSGRLLVDFWLASGCLVDLDEPSLWSLFDCFLGRLEICDEGEVRAVVARISKDCAREDMDEVWCNEEDMSSGNSAFLEDADSGLENDEQLQGAMCWYSLERHFEIYVASEDGQKCCSLLAKWGYLQSIE